MKSFASFRKAAGPALSGALPTTLILTYHRVTTEDGPDPWELKVTPSHFRKQMEVLSNHQVLSLAQAVRCEKPRSVAITFDDGYEDNLLEAAPVLLEYEYPATFFIVSGEPHTPFWWDIVSSRNLTDRYDEFLSMDPARRDDLLKPASDLPRRLNRDQIRQLGKLERCEIGAHTVTHPLLSRLTTTQVARELQECREDLERILKKPVTSFSYPHGTPPTDLSLLQKSGFQRACTMTPDRVWKYTDPYRLPRVQVKDWNGEQFQSHLEGWLQ